MTKRILVITTSSGADPWKRAAERLGTSAADVLDFGQDRQFALPPLWRRLNLADFIDPEALRRDFLGFLESWPHRPLLEGRSFDEMFRRRGNYSVWWSGVAKDRHPDRGIFPILRILWICDRVIGALAPVRIVIHTRRPEVAWALAARCRWSGTAYEFLRGSAQPAKGEPEHGLFWVIKALAKQWLIPCKAVVRAAGARFFSRTRPVASTRAAPSIVYVSELSRDLRAQGDRMAVWFWQEVREALAGLDPGLQHAYRVVYRNRSWLHQDRWDTVDRVKDALPPDERNPVIHAWIAALPDQIRSLLQYYRVERSPSFRDSFVFANTDVSCFYVPKLRRAVERSAEWAQAVGAAVESLRAAGDVKALMVVKEMYASEMVSIAAARELGIPTIGVQHGTIFPMHLIYTVPRGYVEGAPVPDYFAVYGEYAKDVVSRLGSYPAHRVLVTGGARFDRLVRQPADRASARRRVGLPLDARVILLTTQFYPWFPEAARALFQAAARRTDCTICVKTHQIFDRPLDFYRDLAREVGLTGVRYFEDHFEDLLSACDVLVSASSTTVFEAILLGRPTICVNFSDEPDRYPYVSDGGSLGARREEELSDALDLLLSNDASEELAAGRQRFLRQHAGPSAEGLAAEALARSVLAVAGSPGQSAKAALSRAG